MSLKKYREVTDKVVGARRVGKKWLFKFDDGSVKVFRVKEIESGVFELIEEDGKFWGWCIVDTGQVIEYVGDI